ncbi:MAG: hypothetical protein VB144_02090 [Clostridia bacterium]|nr:hypothetical protein [Clostridia bacterium]
MNRTLIILGAELRQIWNATVHGDARKKRSNRLIKAIFGYAVILAVMVGLGVGSHKLSSAISRGLTGYPDLARVIGVNLLAAMSMTVFIMLFMTGVSVVHSALYEAGDLKFLLAAPVPVGSVVSAKLVIALVTNLMAIIPFVYPIWAGYGAGMGAPALFYFASLLSMVMAAVLFTAVVAMIVMLIMRYIPSQKMKQLILVGSLVMGFAFVLVSQVFSAYMSRSNGIDFVAMAQSAGKWGLDKIAWMPHVWVVKTALLGTPGFRFSVWESILPLAAVSLGSFAMAARLATTAFLGGWSSSREVDSAKSGRRRESLANGASMPSTLIGRYPGQVWGVVAKDITVNLRLPTMWYGVLVSLVAAAFLMYNMSFGARQSGPEAEIMFRDLILFMTIMLAAVSTGQVASMGISMDGEGLWLLKSAPVRPGLYYSAKLMAGAVPSAFIVSILMIGAAFVRSVPQYPLYISLPVAYAAVSLLAAFQVMLDALRPNFAIRVSGSAGAQKRGDAGKALILVGIGQLGTAAIGAIFAFPHYYTRIRLFAGMSSAVAASLGYGLFAVIVVLGHLISRRLAVGSIQSIMAGRE